MGENDFGVFIKKKKSRLCTQFIIIGQSHFAIFSLSVLFLAKKGATGRTVVARRNKKNNTSKGTIKQ